MRNHVDKDIVVKLTRHRLMRNHVDKDIVVNEELSVDKDIVVNEEPC